MSPQLFETQSLRIAVEGCGHGTLNAIYASIEKACEVNKWDGIDLLVIGGDFQAVRNAQDLNCMSVPIKFREIGDFHEYYSGARKAPYLTIFVGGNHEAGNHLFELYYGGWVAPNIYYLGAANVIRLGPLRIAGFSGIWKGYNYNKPHYERLPYNQDDVKSIYHVREIDIRKMLQIRTQVDIGISHDWPKGIEWKGNYKSLFAKKDLFEADARSGRLGSTAAKYVLERLRPPYWFSAHLHIKYAAVVEHDSPAADATGGSGVRPFELAPGNEPPIESTGPSRNEEEIEIDMDEDEVAPVPPRSESNAPAVVSNDEEIQLDLDDEVDTSVSAVPEEGRTVISTGNADNISNMQVQPGPTSQEGISDELRAQLPESFFRQDPSATVQSHPPLQTDIFNKSTRFLALDKCLPNRKFLQILDIPPPCALTSSEGSSDGRPSGSSTSSSTRPFRLEYDKEWLAITRVFANDLKLGDPSASLPRDQGEAYYRPLIEKEEEWVEEHVVKPGKMVVPDNFEITAPIYDPVRGPRVPEQPSEYTNPQTSRFCELLDIDNPFDATEEQRAERMRIGPRPDAPRGGASGGGYRGRGGGGFRGSGRGRGSRGRGGRGGRGHRAPGGW
ncbi:DBR1-domain-containing protein [Xylona heveae TC161]|uniref:DBR1-domain-containing protein n=1 Tax=Xylona heveae (strain CBS 132557 / TC161) TaxID=1328760 RepID=A0A164ZR95_XYLHT|nr:DBR1-domain-containing protein [Xylona heveae TC161]KZF19408.1 DBR1-domain-containing protein [Xylona heveae TC161]